jgi:DNA mismatch repair ATPase MutS
VLNADEDPQRIVLNDVCLDDSARLYILTGPNQGGKTTYTQGLGVMQILGQAGLFVPARSAVLSPVDHVESHFPSEEKGSLETGRLAEEARRLSALFDRITDRSLVLLNETLSSTSPGEGLYLAEDVVKGLRLSGARGVFATHLHELAERAELLNAEVEGGSRIGSLVAGIGAAADRPGGEARRTYQIRKGPPMGKSYARDIAERYGISFRKIQRRLEDRRTPPSEEHTGT